MSDIPEILTAKIVAEIAWKVIKEGYAVTKDSLCSLSKKWILTDTELEVLASSIATAPESDLRTPKYLEAYLDDHEEAKSIIEHAKAINTTTVNQAHSGIGNNINQTHHGDGDNVAGNKYVGK